MTNTAKASSIALIYQLKGGGMVNQFNIYFLIRSSVYFSLLKGTKRQHSGQMSKIFKTEKALEIPPVRPTEVCGKVQREENG